MPDLCVNWTFGSLTIYASPADGPTDSPADRLVLVQDGISGWDAPPIRRPRDPASRQDGANVFHAYDHGKIIVVQATMSIGSTGHEDGLTTAYMTAYNNLEAAVKSVLFGALNTPTAFGCTPTGGSPESIQAVYGDEGGEVTFTGPQMNRLCTFTLLEADAIID